MAEEGAKSAAHKWMALGQEDLLMDTFTFPNGLKTKGTSLCFEEPRPGVSELPKFSWKRFCIYKIWTLNTYRQSNNIKCSYYYGLFVQRKTLPVQGKLKERTENRSWKMKDGDDFLIQGFTISNFLCMLFLICGIQLWFTYFIYNYTYVSCFTFQSVVWVQSFSLQLLL